MSQPPDESLEQLMAVARDSGSPAGKLLLAKIRHQLLGAERPQIGRFHLIRLLGRGSSGFVFEAEDPDLHRRVAIKVLAQAGDDKVRILREAQTLAQLSHPHIVAIHDVADDPAFGPFVVMELLFGATLADHLREHGPLSPGQAIHWIKQACKGLHHAHEQGVVHRDLKPSNLFLCSSSGGRPSLKIIDFGLSTRDPKRSVDGSAESPPALVGSPAYMSPEQMEQPERVDQRTDIWALSVTLFEMLSGQLPFSAQSLPELCRKITSCRPPSLSSLVSDVPPEVAAVVSQGLEPNRERRFSSVNTFATALSDAKLCGTPRTKRTVAWAVSTAAAVAVVAALWVVRDTEQACDEVRSDPLNCGACGHSCLGAQCSSGMCEPEILIDDLIRADRVEVRDGYLYWTIDRGGDSWVRRLALEETPRVLETLAGPEAAAQDLAVSNATAYWPSRGTIKRKQLAGGIDRLLDDRTRHFKAIAIDGEYLYWTEDPQGNVGRVALDGLSASELLFTDQGRPADIATDGASVYWVDLNTPGAVYKANRDGSDRRALATLQENPSHLAVDTTHVYWSNAGVEFANGSVHRVNKDGSGAEETLNLGGSPHELAVDSVTGCVYWVDSAQQRPNTHGRILKRCPGEAAPHVLAADQAWPLDVALDEQYVYWSNRGVVNSAPGSIVRVAK